MKDVLVAGKTSFKIEVPYKLIETGKKGTKKPLILYLHGFGGHLENFLETCESCLELSAYHLFIQGPYPIYNRSGKKTVNNWGRAWYLYDGKRKQFIKSLEITSEFIQEIIDNLIKFIDVSRLCVIGYSMGGYQAGYFALTRWKHVNELVCVGGRIKTEVVNQGNWKNLKHLRVLALHGSKDNKVSPVRQKEEIETLKKNHIQAEFHELPTGHAMGENTVQEIKLWLESIESNLA